MKGRRHLTIVIKLGSSSIVHEKTHEPLLSTLTLIVKTAVKLHKDGHRVIIVSSGAIAVGLRRMDVEKKPKHLPRIQALAAVGQCRLMTLWDSLFGHLRQPIAQVLLTRNDIADRTQYQNAQNTFIELFNLGVIPIVNENDTIAVTEIRFGDNDTLSAITAAMVQADYLFLMTDVDCLYDKNPRSNPDAQPIEVVEDVASLEADVSTAGSSLGTGGMSTKLIAARLATSAGVTTVITRSSNPDNISRIVEYAQSTKKSFLDSPTRCVTPSEEGSLSASISSLHLEVHSKPPLHTRFLPDPYPIRDRSFWLLHGLAAHGTVYIDEGAHRALASKAGLLPAGVVDVDGHFAQQESVRLVVVSRKSPTPLTRAVDGAPSTILPSSNQSTPESNIQEDVQENVQEDVKTPVDGAPSPVLPSSNQSAPESNIQEDVQKDIKAPVDEAPSTTLPCSNQPTSANTTQVDVKAPMEVGRALVNYSAAEIARIKGLQSTEIQGVLGYADSEYVALRENVSLIKREKTSRPATPRPADLLPASVA